jgi:adenylosuccinate synthase
MTGGRTTEFPQTLEELYDHQPIYEELKGWTEKQWKKDKLTTRPKAYVKKLEKLCGVPINIVSVGPSRKETLVLKE